MKIGSHLYLVGSEQFALSHPLDCNTFLVDCGGPLLVIDPGRGLDVDAIERNIRADGLDPRRIAAVLVTHSHDGHTAAVAEFQARYGCELWAPRAAVDVLAEGTDPGIPLNRALGLYPDGWVFPCVQTDLAIDDGDELTLGRARLRAIEVGGHTADSMCFVWEDEGRTVLFAGDTVFHAGRIGLVNLPGSSLTVYRRDIRKLGGLGVDMLCPGHGVFTFARGQRHVDQAIDNLSRAAVPPTFYSTLEFTAFEEAPACDS